MRKNGQYIVFLFIGLLAVNYISRTIYKRFDLTEDKRYSLSKVTKNILKKIDQQLLIQVYLEGDFPSEFKRLQIETRQYLEELQAKNTNVKIQFINPDNIRKRLVKQGMIPSQLTVEEDGKLSEAIIFPWATVSYKNKTTIVPLLPNLSAQSQEEQLQKSIENLEYSFSNAIKNITKNNKEKIAVLNGNGELPDIQLYSFLKEVRKNYHLAKFTLDSVAKNPQKTLTDLNQFDLAIIAKPTEKFTEAEKLTLDQFIMNGGKTLWMIDNVHADQDSLLTSGKLMAYPRDLNLTDLFFSYGIRINNSLIEDASAAQILLATGNIGNKPQFKKLPWFYHPLVLGNQEHTITKNILPVRLQFVTQIDTLKKGAKKIPLLVSSTYTKKTGTPSFVTLKNITQQSNKEQYQSGKQILGVLIEGTLNSAYKDRIKPFKTTKFKEKSNTNKMVVIADGDIGSNQILKGQPHDLAVDKWTRQRFGNKSFLLNTIDYLLDDKGIINLKNKKLKINLLNKQKAYAERTYWQLFNIVLPLALLFIFGFTFNYWRKKKYN